jgi:Fic family protein
VKIPLLPPKPEDLISQLLQSEEGRARFINIVAAGTEPAPGGKYRHWDVLRHLVPPDGLSAEQWWLTIKLARRALYRELPLKDTHQRPFKYAVIDAALSMLHQIDQRASGALKGGDQVTDPQTRDTYLFKSLVEEAITSSQLEGAATTREVAKDMLQRGRGPANRSEQMIHNNFQAMQFIRTVRHPDLTPSMVFELHRILTEGTLADPGAAGRFRREDEPVQVVDEVGRILHAPPHAKELSRRLDALCRFANGSSEKPFMHPAIRAILIHFWLAYDHPFVNGNGRTARALFYWSMARQGYWLLEFISISRIIKQAPGRYTRAFLYTEADENDVTYFVLNQLRVTVRAIDALHEYLGAKAAELQKTRQMIENSRVLNAVLNPRQLSLINHALKNPGFQYLIASHRRSHGVSYQTARTDLLDLVELALLDQQKEGKSFVFVAPRDLDRRLSRLGARKRPR